MDLPDGQITSDFQNQKSSPICKNISVFPKRKSPYMMAIPSHSEGRFAIVTDVGRGAVDARAATDARGSSVRQNRVVLAPEAGAKPAEAIRQVTVATEFGSPGRARHKP